MCETIRIVEHLIAMRPHAFIMFVKYKELQKGSVEWGVGCRVRVALQRHWIGFSVLEF